MCECVCVRLWCLHGRLYCVFCKVEGGGRGVPEAICQTTVIYITRPLGDAKGCDAAAGARHEAVGRGASPWPAWERTWVHTKNLHVLECEFKVARSE